MDPGPFPLAGRGHRARLSELPIALWRVTAPTLATCSLSPRCSACWPSPSPPSRMRKPAIISPLREPAPLHLSLSWQRSRWPRHLTSAIPLAAPQSTSLNRMSLQRLMPYLDALWLAGVLFLSLRALGGWWLIRRLRAPNAPGAPHTLLLRLDVLRRQMGIPRLVDLRLSERIASPLHSRRPSPVDSAARNRAHWPQLRTA